MNEKIRFTRLYLIGHKASLALALMLISVGTSIATGTTSIPLPWVQDTTLGLSVNHLLAVVLLASHVTLLTGELSFREEVGARSWRWADTLGQIMLLLGPAVVAGFGNPGLLQSTLLYLAMYFLITLIIGPGNAYPAVLVLVFILTLAAPLVGNPDILPVYWEPDARIIAGLGAVMIVTFLAARHGVKTATTPRFPIVTSMLERK